MNQSNNNSNSYIRYASPPPNQNQNNMSGINQHYSNYQQQDPYYSNDPNQNQHQGGVGNANAPAGSNFAQNLNVPWPGFGSSGNNVMNDATAQMGVQFGKQMAQVGGDYVNRNVSGSFETQEERIVSISLRT